MDGVNTLFSNANWLRARELGMGLVDAIPPLRWLHAAGGGLSLAPMPRLLTGQRL